LVTVFTTTSTTTTTTTTMLATTIVSPTPTLVLETLRPRILERAVVLDEIQRLPTDTSRTIRLMLPRPVDGKGGGFKELAQPVNVLTIVGGVAPGGSKGGRGRGCRGGRGRGG
jgi:hypothetical protein